MPLRAGVSSSTKRTPRSTMRRARRHSRPNSSVSGESSPPSLRVTSGFHFVDGAEAVEHALVQRAQQVQLALLQRGSSFARLEVGDGMLAFAAQRALVGSRQKAAAKQIESARRNQPALQHDEPGQIVALAAQTESHPSAHLGRHWD